MKVKIYSPTRNPMQSGNNRLGEWVIAIPPAIAPSIDPLMGWTSMPDTTQQLTLRFSTKEEAIDYAKHNSLVFEIVDPKERVIKPKSYAANFAFKRESRA